MNFNFTEEQVMLRDALGGFLTDCYTMDVRRTTIAGLGWSPNIWRAFAEDLGILGALLPEAYGGLGGGPAEAMILMEEMGKALVVEPFLETVVIGSAVIAAMDADRATPLANSLIAGNVRLAVAHSEPQSRYNLANVETNARPTGAGYEISGHKSVVVGAPVATHILVPARTAGDALDRDGITLFLVENDEVGMTRRNYRTIDGRNASELYFERKSVGKDSIVGDPGKGLELLEGFVDRAVAALCGEACGVMRMLLDGTIAYTRERRQFGQPLSSFQVLQHRMVDMMIQLENAISMTMVACMELAAGHASASRSISAAKVSVGEACDFVGKNAVQLHGAMGTTEELAISHFFKRAMIIEREFGSSDYHLARYAELTRSESRPADSLAN